jgi:hypothetical protein
VQQNQSEVARLRRQIDEEYQAACRGLHGLAEGSARHEFINKKMQNIQAAHELLAGLIGKEEAMELVTRTIGTIQK